jgi:hypothetical protein
MATCNVNFPPPYYISHTDQCIPAPVVHNIRDWSLWSIISLFIGWGLGSIFPLIFSLICRSKKRSNNIPGAQLMSTLALVFNILITIGGIAGWLLFIIWIVLYRRTTKVYT